MPKSPEVDAWFATYEHPMRDAMLRVREILLGADARLTECIKWKSPTFMYEGNLASFNPRTKAHVSLMFHTGAQIPGKHPRLLGEGDTARYLKISSLEDAEAAKKDLERIAKAWIASKSAPKKAAVKKAAVKKAAVKKTAVKKTAVKKAAVKKKR
ncbi:MAG: DUF1801 domain-containing protein [Sandaracinaceae bacterium]|nr:DUF1801 domain-containing protein [Sandaracinaceae bacterium]